MVYYREPTATRPRCPAGARRLAGLVRHHARMRPASPSAPPRRATRSARAAAAPRTRCSTGLPAQPRREAQVWRRITLEATAWRFNRYAERARAASGPTTPAGGLSAAPDEPLPGRMTFADSVRRIVPLAWPVFIGQVRGAGLQHRRHGAGGAPLAGRPGGPGGGRAAYITVFIGLMGVVLAVGPIVGQLYGARRLPRPGDQLHQAVWLALGLSVLGSTLLAFPARSCALSRPRPEVAEPGCAATCWPWPCRCRPRCCSRSTAASTPRSRGPRR
jgi:hypothetical protein